MRVGLESTQAGAEENGNSAPKGESTHSKLLFLLHRSCLNKRGARPMTRSSTSLKATPLPGQTYDTRLIGALNDTGLCFAMVLPTVRSVQMRKESGWQMRVHDMARNIQRNEKCAWDSQVRYAAFWTEEPYDKDGSTFQIFIYDEHIIQHFDAGNASWCMVLHFDLHQCGLYLPEAQITAGVLKAHLPSLVRILCHLGIPTQTRKAVALGLSVFEEDKQAAPAAALGSDGPSCSSAACDSHVENEQEEVHCTGSITWQEKNEALKRKAIDVDAEVGACDCSPAGPPGTPGGTAPSKRRC